MTSSEDVASRPLIHALKYTLSTLIQGVAPTLRHQLLEQPSHHLYSIDQMLQFRELSLRERPPAFRRAGNIAETKEQVANFIQCETELTGTLNDGQAIKHCGVVTPLPAEPLCWRKQANPLVVANRRGSQSNLARDLRDG